MRHGLGGWEWDGVGLAVGVGEGPVDEWDELCAEAGLEFVQVTGREEGRRNEFGGTFTPSPNLLLTHSPLRRIFTDNGYDGAEKTGISRVREALEANDWAQLTGPDDLSDFGDFEEASGRTAEGDGKDDGGGGKELDPESLDFGFDRADFEGLRKAIWSAGQMDDQQGDGDDGAAAEEEGARMAGGPRGVASSKDDEDKGPGAAKDDREDKSGLDDEDVAKVERMMRKLQAAREAGEGMGQEQRRRMAAQAVEEVMKEL